MRKNNFKENYDAKIVERRRSEMLLQLKDRRKRAHDHQRVLTMRQVASTRKTHFRTLLEMCDLNVSLQLSEWLPWKPADLKQWQLVPCPVGLRCLVVAHSGRTEMISKSGKLRKIFHSLLPGDKDSITDLTVLDGVYNKETDAIYVLDALFYGTISLVHCEAEFRSYWLHSKFRDTPGLEERSESNRIPFKWMPHFDFNYDEVIREVFMCYPQFSDNKPPLDGFLFYHKYGDYVYGSTPLVGWLLPFMVPDVLGYEVNKKFVKPPNYTTTMQYIADFDAKLAAKACKRVKKLQLSNKEQPLKRKIHHNENDDHGCEDDDEDDQDEVVRQRLLEEEGQDDDTNEQKSAHAEISFEDLPNII